MFVSKRMFSLILCLLICLLVTDSCSGEQDSQQSEQRDQPTQSFTTFTPVAEGSAKLNYQMVVDNPPVYTATETDEIILHWKFDPENPKQLEELKGDLIYGSYFVQIEGTSNGEPCYSWFDIPVEISVFGLYKPYPNCSFSVVIDATPQKNNIERGHNCGSVMDQSLAQYPADLLFIPPPSTEIVLSGVLQKTIKINDVSTLTISLTDVVVNEASGCQW